MVGAAWRNADATHTTSGAALVVVVAGVVVGALTRGPAIDRTVVSGEPGRAGARALVAGPVSRTVGSPRTGHGNRLGRGGAVAGRVHRRPGHGGDAEGEGGRGVIRHGHGARARV